MVNNVKKRLVRALERKPGLYNRVRAIQRGVRGQRQDKHRAVVSLEPSCTPRGAVLISLIIEPFLRKPGEPISHSHTHDWETVEIAQVWRDLGYTVDVIRWSNREFLPAKPYTFFIDARANLERLAPHLPGQCTKVMHIDTAHWLFHTAAQYQRLMALRERRGVALQPWRALPPDRAIETADYATYLGNAFTRETYDFAGKPMYRTAVSTTDLFEWPESRDMEAARRRFVWFGSDGLVHKGLDITLEAFTAMPDLHLTVCGPVAAEKAFAAEYHKELYETPNITTVDWIDIHSDNWVTLARETGGVVYPSCSEGGGGSVITCMHAGMLPIVTREASVDTGDFGVAIREGSVEAVKEAVQQAAELPPTEFESRARAGWDHVRAHHTREAFSTAYRDAAQALLAETGRA